MPTSADYLKKVPLFLGLNESQRDLLAASCRRRVYRAREHIFYQGDAGSQLYVVMRGGIKIYQQGGDGGQETTLALLMPGECFGEMALLTEEGERSASAVTIADETELLILDQMTFFSSLRDSFELTRALFRVLAHRLSQTNENLVALASDSSLARVAKLLLVCITEGSEQNCPPLSQEEIANMVGVRRETIARNLAKLESIGILKRNRGNLAILDRKRLEEIARTGHVE